jgi:hypothetical protein
MRIKSLYLFIIKYLAFFLIILFALICFFCQKNKSVTVDEFSHFPSGIYNLITFDWRMDRESPPLIKCIPAITSIFTKPKIDTKLFESEPNTWSLGYHFMYNNWNKYKELFQYGRCIIILFGCFLGWLLYKFGTEIYGKNGGLFALFLYVFNPNIIAHSRLITIDIGASCAIFLCVFYFWKHLKKRDSSSAILSGITLGLAQLSKFTALLLYPIFLIIIGVLVVKRAFLTNRRSVLIKEGNPQKEEALSLQKDIGSLFVIVLVSILVINTGYLFSGTLISLGEYQFLSGPLKKISSLLWNALPVPLPYDYLSGFDSQLAISAGHHPFYTSYLMGEHSLTGWWYYYIIAFIVKNPLALLIILALTVFVWTRSRQDEADLETGLCIWLPAVVFLFYFSIYTHISIGIRFLLPIFPFLFLAAGKLCNVWLLKGKAAKAFMGVLLIGYIISAIFTFPNYLSYFNLASGGPSHGHKWLIDSNLDWGQDLPELKRYMEKNGIEKIKLGYFGRVDPELYGIRYTLPETDLEEGNYAISVNHLVGRPYYLLKEYPKELLYVGVDYFKNYRLLKPVEIINNTIYIFDVESGSI